MTGQKPREIAVQILQRRKSGEFIENLLDSALQEAVLSPPDRALCQELVYGVVRWQATLDWLIDRKTGQRPQKPLLRSLLQLGLYQIFWLDRIPNHAAVHETVESAKRHGFNTQAGFVNAVLRGYLREFDATKAALVDLKVSSPAIGYSHPGWLVERWRERFGAEQTVRLLEWNNSPAKTFVRINLLKTDAAKLIEQWRNENVTYDFVRHDWVEQNLVFELKSYPPLTKLPSFQAGLFYVQDPSTLLAVQALAPKPGEAILDVCAAPGGKVTFIAQTVRNEARIVARDIAPGRLKLIQENCHRLGVTCVTVELSSATSTAAPAAFDRVLLDAPCSNTGVMRRRVELRWRVQREEITRLRTMQLELLAKAQALVKPGGTLVYSTCSLEPEENENVVSDFLAAHPGFKLQSQRALLPFKDAVDGAYVATLIR